MQHLKYSPNISNLAKYIKGEKSQETWMVKHVKLIKGLILHCWNTNLSSTIQTIKF